MSQSFAFNPNLSGFALDSVSMVSFTLPVNPPQPWLRKAGAGLAWAFTAVIALSGTAAVPLAFAAFAPAAAFGLSLALTGMMAMGAWVAWRFSAPAPRKSVLIGWLLYVLAWQGLMAVGARAALTEPAALFYANLYVGVLLGGIVLLGVALWRLRNPANLAPPQAQSWRGAPLVITSYGTPWFVHLGIACGVIGISLVLALAYLRAHSAGLSRGQLAFLVAFLLHGNLLGIAGALHAARDLLRTRFPDRPCLWLANGKLNVRGRFALDCAKITRIEYHRLQMRSGSSQQGLDIYSSELVPGEFVTIGFTNMTVKPRDAMRDLQSALDGRGIVFEDVNSSGIPAETLAWTKAELKRRGESPRMRRKVGKKLLANNPTFKISIEQRIAGIPAQMARIDDLIAAAGKRNAATIAQLAQSAARIGWPQDGTALAPSRTWPEGTDYKTLNAADQANFFRDSSIVHHLRMQQWVNDFPAEIEKLEASRQSLQATAKSSQDLLEKYFS